MKERILMLALLGVLLSCGGGETPIAVKDIVAEAETLEVSADVILEIEVMEYGFEEESAEELEEGEVIEPPQQFCNDNNDCISGWCVETPEGKVCTKTCSSNSACPIGWECVQVQSQPDVVWACVHPAPRECMPCKTSEDCKTAYGSAKMSCAEVSGYYWCFRICQDGQCPEGYKCEIVRGETNGICIPQEGGCKCTKVGLGAKGACKIVSEYGTCNGEFTCQDQSPTECEGPSATLEECNNKDDDCDGETDEDIVDKECKIENPYGVCTGKEVCIGGKVICQGAEPKPEVCNGIDENCDGKTDEGYADMDGDGIADCVDMDKDGDGVENEKDNCPDTPNMDQSDLDQDKEGDACDSDDDNDGVADMFDNCPTVKNPQQEDLNNNGIGDACDEDKDGDGIPNEKDNCPDVANPNQEDLDSDGFGDDCDLDKDGDGVWDVKDNCPDIPNMDQTDKDGDGFGDVCDNDLDGDGVPNDIDNCVSVSNTDQLDKDQDGKGDLCDLDDDGDGVPDEADNCPLTFNPDQKDENVNGIGDECEKDWDGDGIVNEDDNCPWVANPSQDDLDGDIKGDVCDCDIDGDGVANLNPGCPKPPLEDNCPFTPNQGQEDLDNDGKGDVCDSDIDGDLDPNEKDCAPTDPSIYHGQKEVCDGVDNNCDGNIDEEGASQCKIYYQDEDGDGFGGGLQKCLCQPKDKYTAEMSKDCNDSDPLINPNAKEVCGNGKDDNCNGSENDEGAEGCVKYYTDLDKDGWGSGEGKCLCTAVGDLTALKKGDCDDNDPLANPGLQEKCGDEKDNDCNGKIDEEGCQGCIMFFRDDDGDKYGLDYDKKCLPVASPPYSALVGGDCDDQNPSVNPSAQEICNKIDDNCDGKVDPQGASGCEPYYPDIDKDGFGANVEPVCYCEPIGQYTTKKTGDCNDNDPEVRPDAKEICGNGKDDNCNGSENDEDADGCVPYYLDNDADGWGIGEAKCLCNPTGKRTALKPGDCLDNDPDVNPGLQEKCNDGKDNDCNGLADEENCQGCTTFYKDEDKDGFGITEDKKCLGKGVAPYTATKGGDCDDSDFSVNPQAKEICNEKDDNCDSLIDPVGAGGCKDYWPDVDNDGFGANVEAKCYCKPTGNYKADKSGDCNDNDPDVNPSKKEICGNGKDDNCNGSENDENAQGCVQYYLDNDSDGYGVGQPKCLCAPTGSISALKFGDCNDNDPQMSPGLTEICNDSKDNNCNGKIDEEGCQGCQDYYKDMDQDKYGVDGDKKCLATPAFPYTAVVGGDCNDNDANIRPGATEVCNGKDDNCDGEIDPSGTQGCQLFYPDNDKDGYGANLAAICYCKPTGIYTATVSNDCNDNDPSINPAKPEICDSKDNNCNGQVDEGVQITYYQDNDGDGYGGTATKLDCQKPQGYTEKPGDCNDFNKDINPGAKEVCNDIDDNCNGQIDEGLPTQKIYKDNDGDGYAPSNAASQMKCNVPVGWTLTNNPPDCDDSDVTVYPGAKEICDGKDNDCNGLKDTSCPTACGDNWPVYLGPGDVQAPISTIDMDNDGQWEIIVSYKQVILNPDGTKKMDLPGCSTSWWRGNIVQLDGRPDFYWDFVCLNKVFDVSGLRADITGSYGSPAVGDVTGDGILDVVTSTSSGYVANIGKWDSNNKWQKDKTLTLPTNPPSGAWLIYSPVLVDLDGDGILEVMSGSGYMSNAEGDHPDGKVYAWKYDKNSQTFKRYCPIDPNNPDICFNTGEKYWWTYSGAVLDLDGDGKLDIIFPPNGYYRFDTQGNVVGKTGGLPIDLDHNGVWEMTGSYGWIYADFDLDGKEERAYGNNLQELDGTSLQGWPVPAKGNTYPPAVGDIDGDGRTEIVYADGMYIQCWKLGEKTWDPKKVYWYGDRRYMNAIQYNGQYDPFEPTNDDYKIAPIMAGRYGNLTAFIWKSGDVDYYRFPIFGYWTGYTFTVSNIPSGKDYDLYVTNADGTYESCKSVKTGNATESCYAYAYVPNVDFKGYFLVKVVGKGPNDKDNVSPYILSWSKNNN